jgi:DNA-binding NarL/FixJ family response regulator
MASEANIRKKFLFVDDDAGFLAGIREVFSQMSAGGWEIFTAENHAQAMALLRQNRMDVVVLDLDMPVMDGLQFLRLLNRAHPGQQVAILTGRATEESRRACLDSGAALYLEKLIAPEGFASVFAALDALAGSMPREGFRGLMRRVGLHEVLQLECLGRKSSILEIFTARTRGVIFIEDGSIVHAESGALKGEVALYGLLALQGGEFNLRPFAEPSQRTIQGHWESLLMEAARLSDESSQETPAPDASTAESPQAEPSESEVRMDAGVVPAAPAAPEQVRLQEVVLCSGAGEVLYEWECQSIERRLQLLTRIEQQAAQLSSLVRVGRFERLEMLVSDGRIVCETQTDRRLFVRTASIVSSS